ncbi:hypothetical protein ACFLXB_09200 [Chloroflexota bacterium]
MNLAAYLTHILALENDPSKDYFTDAQNTVALRVALYRYSVLRPYHSSSLFDGDGTKIVTLTDLTALTIRKVWHVQDDPQNNIELDFYAYLNAGVWTVETKNYAVPTGTENVQVDTGISHTIDGLDGASDTTIPAQDEFAVADYAAGCACRQMAISNTQTNNLNPKESDRYEQMGTLLINNFNSLFTKEQDVIRTANWHDDSIDKDY